MPSLRNPAPEPPAPETPAADAAGEAVQQQAAMASGEAQGPSFARVAGMGYASGAHAASR